MKVKAASLVLDYSMYPRHKVNDFNVRAIRDALEAGTELPPVIAEKGTRIVVDGFHRVEAHKKLNGPEADIEVKWKTYETKAHRLLDAIRLNAAHGDRLTKFDQVRCALLAGELSIAPEVVASVLNMTATKYGSLVDKRSAIGPDGKREALKGTSVFLAGKKLTEKQVSGNKIAGGPHQLYFVNQIIMFLEHDLLDTENETLLSRLDRLEVLLGTFLSVKEREEKVA